MSFLADPEEIVYGYRVRPHNVGASANGTESDWLSYRGTLLPSLPACQLTRSHSVKTPGPAGAVRAEESCV